MDFKTLRKTLGFMLRTAWEQRPALFFTYFMTFCADILGKIRTVLLPKFIIDELILLLEEAFVQTHLRNVVLFAALTVGSQFVEIYIRNTANLLKEIHHEWLEQYFQLKLASHAMQMDFEHTEDPDALDQLNRAKEGISWYSGGVVGVLNEFYQIVMNGTIFCGVVAVILWNCPLLVPLQFLSLVLITIFNAKNNKIEVESFQKLAKSNRIFGYVFYQLADIAYGKDIRLYNSAEMMGKKADHYTKEQIQIWADTSRRTRKNAWIMDSINSLRDGFSYFYIGYLALKKRISVGDFSMCVAAASTLYWSIAGIVTGVQQITKKCSYAYQFLRFLEYPAAMPKGTLPIIMGNKNNGSDIDNHVIEFRNVSFRYPRSEKFVLKNINLTISQGEHLAVVGLNGAGKTTLIKLLCRLYDVTEGAILIDGINIKDYATDEYRRLFAVVFQDFKLFAFTLKENVHLAEEIDDSRIAQVLKQSGLYEEAQKLDNGLDTMIFKSFDEHGTELSGGQQQKTAISRALYRNAPIVILDEPTAALDPVAEYEIYRQFHSLVGGKTAIYISHRLSSCKFCDKIAVFAQESIKEYGSHEELIHIPNGIYAEMFAAQAQYYTKEIDAV